MTQYSMHYKVRVLVSPGFNRTTFRINFLLDSALCVDCIQQRKQRFSCCDLVCESMYSRRQMPRSTNKKPKGHEKVNLHLLHAAQVNEIMQSNI